MESVSYASNIGSSKKSQLLWISLFFVTISSAILFSHPYHAEASTWVTSNVTSTRSWTVAGSPYIVSSTISITAGTLTVDAGAVVKFRSTGSSLTVNANTVLNVQGTAASSTYFTSYKDDIMEDSDGTTSTPAAGDWTHIKFAAGSSGTIAYAIVRYGGQASGGSNADINNVGGMLTLSNVEIASSSNYGLLVSSGTSTVDSSNFHNQPFGAFQTGGYLSISSSTIHDHTSRGFDTSGGKFTITSSTLTNNAFTGQVTYSANVSFTHSGNTANGTGGYRFYMVSNIPNDTTWNNDGGIPYAFLNTTIPAGKTLTISPGVIVKVDSSGWLETDGTLNALGTTSSPIYFTSLKDDSIGGDSNNDGTATVPAAGNWRHIITILGGTTNISNAVVRYGGSTTAPGSGSLLYNTTGTLTIANTLVATSSNYGIYMTSGTTNITSSTIRNTTTYGIYVTSGTLSVAYSDIGNQKEGIHITGGTVSGGSNSIHDNTVYGAFKSAAPTSTLLYNYWGTSTGPYNTSTNSTGKGNAVSDYIDYNPWLSQAPACNGCSYWAKIKNTGGNWTLRQNPGTSQTALKTLPIDWVLYVSSTASPTGTSIVANGYKWYEVIDYTDSVAGWMAGENTSTSPTYYLPYDSSSQAGFATTSAAQLTTKGARANKIVEAVNSYWANVTTTDSLYNTGFTPLFSNATASSTFPKELFYGIAAAESGSKYSFNNEVISFDYGHGVMQITTTPTSSDIYYLQVFLNNSSDTALNVPAGDPGSPGHETSTFGAATDDAVKRFQAKYSTDTLVCAGASTSTGIVGQCMRLKLNSMLPTSTIPSYFKFEEYMSSSTGNKDILTLSGKPNNRGIGSKIDIPPCDDRQDPTSNNYMKKCYEMATSSPSGLSDIKVYEPHQNYSSTTFKYYSNTSQSVYSNIKDGLTVLSNNYAPLCVSTTTVKTVSSTDFQCYEREWIRDTWDYNGHVLTTTYLTSVASQMDTYSDYVSPTGTQLVATSSFTVDLANKLRIADNNKVTLLVYSPVTISITDSAGRKTGYVNGVKREEIPDSAYNSQREAVVVFFPENEPFTYTLVGTDDGTYGIRINQVRQGIETEVYAPTVPVRKGEVDTYTVDWDAVARGRKGVTVKIDNEGDGTIDKVIQTDKALSDLGVPSSNR